jgi:hypothetical protein
MGIATGALVKLTASIRVGDFGVPNPQFGFLLRRQGASPRLQMIMDGRPIYDEDLESTGGTFKEVESGETEVSDNPKVEIVQEGGAQPVDLTIRGIKLAEAESPPVNGETTRGESPPGETTQAESPPGETTQAEPAPGETTRAQTAPVGTTRAQTAPGVTTQAQSAPGESAPVETTQAESAPGGQETSAPSGTGKGGGGGESGGVESETGTGTGTGTGPASSTSSEPSLVVPNEGGYDYTVNKAVVYVVPLVAAFLI